MLASMWRLTPPQTYSDRSASPPRPAGRPAAWPWRWCPPARGSVAPSRWGGCGRSAAPGGCAPAASCRAPLRCMGSAATAWCAAGGSRRSGCRWEGTKMKRILSDCVNYNALFLSPQEDLYNSSKLGALTLLLTSCRSPQNSIWSWALTRSYSSARDTDASPRCPENPPSHCVGFCLCASASAYGDETLSKPRRRLSDRMLWFITLTSGNTLH